MTIKILIYLILKEEKKTELLLYNGNTYEWAIFSIKAEIDIELFQRKYFC